jgi:putative transposase
LNRTSQERFVDWYTDSLDDPDVFNRSLMNYLIWYNTKKPHIGIGKKPPLRYYLENFATPEKSNMLWPLTSRCQLVTGVVLFSPRGMINTKEA